MSLLTLEFSFMKMSKSWEGLASPLDYLILDVENCVVKLSIEEVKEH